MPRRPLRCALVVCSLYTAAYGQGRLLADVGGSLPDGIGQVIASADFDGDGDGDLVTSAGVYLANLGVFELGATMPGNYAVTSDVRAVVVADLDGDGRAEVVVAQPSAGGSGLTVMSLPLGGASLVATPLLPAALTAIGALAAADFDADGDVDLVCAASSVTASVFELLLNDGVGGFTLAGPAQWPSQPLAAGWLGAGDFDGDGAIDIVAATGGVPQWRRNLGGGTFSNNLPSTVALAADSGVVGNFDGDAFDDVVVYAVGGEELALSGSVAGLVAGVVISGIPVTTQVVAGDVDGDGRDDVLRIDTLLRGAGIGELRLQLGSVSGLTASTPVQNITLGFLGSMPFGPVVGMPGVALVDIDGDGDRDVVLAPGGNVPSLFVQAAGALPAPLPTRLPAGQERLFAAPRDIDGDGDVDLLVSRDTSQGLVVESLRNDGLGDFSTPPVFAFTYSSFTLQSPTWGDFDGDGNDDLLMPGGLFGTAASVWLNDGAGQFALATNLPFADVPSSVAVGDFNGDQVVDIVIGRALAPGPGINYQTPILLFGLQTTGGVAFATPIPFGVAELLTDLVAFDADQDGDLDLLAAVSGTTAAGGPARLFENDGSGGLTAQTPFPGSVVRYVAVGDLDGDGDSDLVLGSDTWLAQAGGFVMQSSHAPPISAYSLADLDGDGMLDLFDAAGQWYPGDGTGAFLPPVPFVPYALGSPRLSRGGRVAFDIDADGDLDCIGPHSITPGHLAIYSNLTRHLAPRSLAVAGDLFWLSVHAAPGEPWFVGVSFPPAGGGLALPLFGTLFLDPANLFVLAASVMPPSGRFDLPVGMPASGGGFTLRWQGIVGASLQLTNAFDTPVLF